jgi:protein phosphatase
MELRLQWVDRLLNERARETPGVRSMATAITVAASSGRDLLVGHVGSSRAYHWHEGTLHRLTRDHTRVQSLMETGAIDVKDAAFHPERHIVTRGLGMGNGRLMVDIHHVRLAGGDRVLLCTDGLTGVVADPDILDVFRSFQDATEAAQTLVDQARKSGPPDDATAIVVHYEIAD